MRAAPLILATALLVSPVAAQQAGEPSPNDPAPRRGSEFLIPLGSLLLPGLGQYVHGAPQAGAAFTGTAVAGYALSETGDAWGDTWDGDLPRRGRDQVADQAIYLAATAGMLSSWDSFQRAIPALQTRGKYEFMGRRETVGDLLTAPFDARFLRRWTTWVDLAQTVVVTALVLSDRSGGVVYHPFRANDAAYAAAASMNAAVGEEALFRGWLLPLFHQQTDRFWLANLAQAGLFGAAHLPDAEWFAAFIGGWAAWEGWIVRRNDWSIRESIFHHFWYDVGVITATLLTGRRDAELRLGFRVAL